MEVREGLYYTKEHEWIKVEGSTGIVGITDYAQEELGDIAYIDLPETGKEVKKNEKICDIESVKAVSEIYSPVSGKIIEVNSELEDSPEKINESPYDTWIVKIEIRNEKEIENLMDKKKYEEYLNTL
ncbi:MAG: glycine cleavage system protein GcvH [Methanomicrobia archaeon]|nr:glycine cleavage system protein GcvH [Methanomicrobia archaeon]